jgi:hypothetical protein
MALMASMSTATSWASHGLTLSPAPLITCPRDAQARLRARLGQTSYN